MISENRITVVQGDLIGQNPMASVAQILRANNIKVSGIDVSNVPSYFADTIYGNGYAAGTASCLTS